MLLYVAKRLLSLVPVLLIVSIVIFSIIYLTPGDPADVILGDEATISDVEALREKMGLNDPLVFQYLNWLQNLLQGNLGDSYFLGTSVSAAIAKNMVPTIQLAVLAQLVALVIAIPLGTLSAKYKGSFLDNSVMGFTLFGMAVPSFILGLLLIILFGVTLKVLPVAGYMNIFESAEGFRYLILPAVSLGTIQAALLTRTTRAAVLDVLSSDYIDAARSRGVGESRLLFRHTLKNAGLPVLTAVGLTFGSLVTGSVVTESIFNIPGIGSLLINAIGKRDYPVIQGVIIFITLLYLLVNLIIDLFYGAVDPRVRVQGQSK